MQFKENKIMFTEQEVIENNKKQVIIDFEKKDKNLLYKISQYSKKWLVNIDNILKGIKEKDLYCYSLNA